MALMPEVIHDLVATTKNMTAIDGVVIHTIVGYWTGGKAAHWTTDASGVIRQHRDTVRQSTANLDGNPRWLAIENEDHGSAYGAWNVLDGHAVPSFTTAQCEGIARVLAWVHRTHGVPLELVPDTCLGRRGVAYHRQGITGNYVAEGYRYGGLKPGCVRFSSKTGKVCPGDRRIDQLIQVIIPRARTLAGLESSVAGEADAAFAFAQQRITNTGKNVADFVMVDRALDVINIRAQITALTTAVAALADAVRVGEANDLTESKMRELLTESISGIEDALGEAVIDVDVDIRVPDVTGTSE